MKKLLLILLCLPMIGVASFPINTNISNNKCDILILQNGDEILVNIMEITLSQIKYKKCNNGDGPLISISKKDVVMIKYSDGTNEIIKSSKPDSRSSSRFLISLLGLIAAILLYVLGRNPNRA